MSLELTGERTLPGIPHENYWFRRHEVAYRFAAERCGGLRVVDAGCGEGYGTALLAETARRAVGVDIVGDVCRHARGAYPQAEFVQGDLCDLPLADGSVDAVVSLQVIEHLADVTGYLAEIRRVLRPGGVFVCATPNRLTFTPGPGPLNPHHITEFAPDELARALRRHFALEACYGVFTGPRLQTVEREHGATMAELVLSEPPQRWPRWLTETVARITADDFDLGQVDLDESLDLLVVARRD